LVALGGDFLPISQSMTLTSLHAHECVGVFAKGSLYMSKLKIKDVSKEFISRNGVLPVLRNINMEIEEGEFICVVGPSGSGKTTFLNIIAGLEQDFTGQVFYDGDPSITIGPNKLVIFQELGLFPWLTVEKNVEFGLKIKGIPKKERAEKISKYLDMVRLNKFRKSHIHELSGGMKQRVALARALVMNPDILLMDEPFAALDAQTRDNLHVELQRLWAETKLTIIFVTHNVREAVCLGDRVVVMSRRPAEIKTIHTVDLPRPRHIEDQGIIEIVRVILQELKDEIEKAVKEELGETQNS
jgi:NitT/TauT family transport system ATP-binding protein